MMCVCVCILVGLVKQTKSLGALFVINDKDLFKSLRVCKWEHRKAKIQKCFKEDKKVKNSHSKKCILENNQSCILSRRFGQVGYQLDQLV